MTIERILYHISVFSVLVPLITGIIFHKKLDINSRVMLVLLIFASISQLGVYLPEKFVFYNIYTIVDSAIWGYLFFKNSRNRVIRSAIVIIVFLQAILSIYIFSSLGIKTRFYSEFACLNSLLQVLWVLSFVYERYKRDEIRAAEKEPMFWFCLGILIYAPATYFNLAFYEDIGKTDSVQIIHHLLNTAMYLIFSIGFLANVIRTLKFRNVFSQNRS